MPYGVVEYEITEGKKAKQKANAAPAPVAAASAAPKQRTPAQIAAQQRAMEIMRQRNAERAALRAAGTEPTKIIHTPPTAVKIGGKKVEVGMRPEPAPQKCTVCGAERKFTGYQTKIGKNGRPAKWPGFETCPNLNDPKLHPHKAPALRAPKPYLHPVMQHPHELPDIDTDGNPIRPVNGEPVSVFDDPDAPDPRPTPRRKIGPPAVLLNIGDASLGDAWAEITEAAERRMGGHPKILYVNPAEVDIRLAERNVPKGVRIEGLRQVNFQHVLASIKPQTALAVVD